MQEINLFLEQFGISKEAYDAVTTSESALKDEVFPRFDAICEYNMFKVIHAFSEANVQNRHFSGTTGYGYADEGREKLKELFQNIFSAEAAIVSPLIASGTHAISIALFGMLRPLDTMLSVTGTPYDTLSKVIGIGKEHAEGSLSDYAIKYQEISLTPSGRIDISAMCDQIRLNKNIKIVYIQRSRGYEWRKSITIAEIAEVVKEAKKKRPDIKVVVDNCYGEFTERLEPTEVGADLIIGSLIKNPGGGLAPTGAYLVGTKECIEKTETRLTCAGIGGEIGSYAYGYLPYFQGIYLAPQAVKNALKGAALTAHLFEQQGYLVSPRFDDYRTDITQAIRFHSKTELIRLVQAVQSASPVDSNVVPLPWDMPGYDNPVIMAAGTFMQGGSLELSADAPIRSPYTAYLQGGLVYENVKLALMKVLTKMLEVESIIS